MNAIPTAAVTRTIAAVGAGLALLAIATTAGHFLVVLGYPAITARLPTPGAPGFAVRVVYEDGRGILREVLGESTRRGFAVQRVTTNQLEARALGGVPAVAVTLDVLGQPAVEGLVPALDAMPGVLEVTTAELGRDTE